MGADSWTTDAEGIITPHTLQAKVSKKRVGGGDWMLVGHCGSARLGYLLEHRWTPPEPAAGEQPIGFMGRCADSLGDLLAADPIRRAVFTEEGFVDGVFLVTWRGVLFEICDGLTPYQLTTQHFAIGAGEKVALGALAALQRFEIDPRSRVVAALEATAAVLSSIGPPGPVLCDRGD